MEKFASVVFPITDIVPIVPIRSLSSVTIASPFFTASVVLFIVTAFPSIEISPDCFLSIPNIARRISLRPAPIRPHSPNTSPFRTCKSTLLTPVSEHKPLTSRAIPPSFVGVLSNKVVILRPAIRLINSFIGKSSVFFVSITAPSLITVMLSHIV